MTLKQHALDLFEIALTDEQLTQFDRYNQELADWNTRMNLTAITEPEAVQIRHFLDSLSIVKAVDIVPGMRLIDVGTGAGFPGLPLAIVFPNIEVTLLEATGKKITFLQHMIEVLGLKNVLTLNARAEEAGHMDLERGQYDVVVARAVARLPALLEYLLPLARMNGVCIAMKGNTAHTEVKDSKSALQQLGGKHESTIELTLPATESSHFLITVKKVKKTPKNYPRRPGIPTREPL